MGIRKINENSQSAYKSLDPIRISWMHQKIVDALGVIRKGNYEQIAAQIGEPEKRVWKRLNEVVKAGLIHNTGENILTKDKCKSSVYALRPSPESVTKKKRVMKGPAVQDFSRAINQVQQSIHSQKSLF